MATEDPVALETSHREHRIPDGSRFSLPAIVALALALRATMSVRTSVIFEDGPAFLETARLFSNGDWAAALSHPYHPLYSGLVAIVNTVVRDWETAALMVSVSGGTIAVLALYVFLRETFDARAAAFGAFLLAISPYAVRFTSDVESEGVYLAFFVSTLALLSRVLAREPRRDPGPGRGGDETKFFLAAGVSAGLAYLTRPEGAGLVVVGVGLLAVQWWCAQRSGKQTLVACAGLITGALAVAAPYLWLLAGRGDGLVLSDKKSVLQILGLSGRTWDWSALNLANLPLFAIALVVGVGLILIGLSRRRKASGQPSSEKRGAGFAAGLLLTLGWGLLWPKELAEFAGVLISTLRPEVAVLVVLGLIAVSSQPSKPRDRFIATVLIFYGVLLTGLLINYGYLSRRHMLPLVPAVLGYAGLGAVWVVDRFVRARPGLMQAIRPACALAALAMLMFAVAAPKALRDHREDVLAQRLAAEWLGAQSDRPGSMASNKRRGGYYAGRRWFPLRQGSELRSLDSLIQERVRYIVADDRMLDDRDRMLVPSKYDLREIYRVTAAGRSAMVYELATIATEASPPRAPDISAGPSHYENR